MEIGTDGGFILGTYLRRGELNQERGHRAVGKVDDVLIFIDNFSMLVTSGAKRIQGKTDVFLCNAEHIVDFLLCLYHSRRRHCQQIIIHKAQMVHHPSLFLIVDHLFCKLHQLPHKRQQQQRSVDIEDHVERRYTHLQRHGIASGEETCQHCNNRLFESPNDCRKDCGAYYVEGKMDQCHPLGIGSAAHRCQKRGDTSTDIGAQNNEQCHIQPQNTCTNHSNDHTCGGRRALDQSSEDCANNNQQQRKVNDTENAGKQLFYKDTAKGFGAAHNVKTHEDKTQTAAKATGDLHLFLFHKAHHHARKSKEVHSHIEKVIFQCHQDTCDSRTNICAHNNGHSLHQGHNTGIHKTNNHYRGGRGALNDCRYCRADTYTGNAVSANSAQQLFHTGAGALFQRLAHKVHTDNKNTNAGQQPDHTLDQLHNFIRSKHRLNSFLGKISRRTPPHSARKLQRGQQRQ